MEWWPHSSHDCLQGPWLLKSKAQIRDRFPGILPVIAVTCVPTEDPPRLQWAAPKPVVPQMILVKLSGSHKQNKANNKMQDQPQKAMDIRKELLGLGEVIGDREIKGYIIIRMCIIKSWKWQRTNSIKALKAFLWIYSSFCSISEEKKKLKIENSILTFNEIFLFLHKRICSYSQRLQELVPFSQWSNTLLGTLCVFINSFNPQENKKRHAQKIVFSNHIESLKL